MPERNHDSPSVSHHRVASLGGVGMAVVCVTLSLVFLLPRPSTSPLASTSAASDLPLQIPDEDWRPLRDYQNDPLQKELEARLGDNPRWARLIEQQKLALGIVDLNDARAIRFATVNGDTMMYAASLPKIAILLAACQAFQEGTLFESPDRVRDLRRMIRRSSNRAATRFIELLGFEKIEAVLTSPQYALFDPARGGGLWVGKAYSKSASVKRDPLKSLSHAASVTQVSRFYYLLATGRLINPSRCEQMLWCLSDTAVKHKFAYALEQIAPKAALYRKSGTWKIWHSDSALVWEGTKRRYILVGLVEDADGENILRELVPPVDELLRH